MSSTLKRLTVISSALLIGILLVALTSSVTLAQRPMPWGWGPQGNPGWRGHGMGGGWQGMRHGMMLAPSRSAGMSGLGYGLEPTTGVTGTLPFGYGPGGCPGMGGWGYGQPTTGSRLTLDQAAEVVEEYLTSYGDSDLALSEVMEFAQNFYAEVQEQSTGINAFELLIDPYTGVIHPEPGPNMMWNTKYGHMGSRWSYGSQSPTAEMAVSAEQAQEFAQQYLDTYLPGTSADAEAEPFHGYYTLHVLQDGQIVGMLSVNGFTGQVWYHNWHGEFIGMTEGHD